jgi:hypothetical protein
MHLTLGQRAMKLIDPDRRYVEIDGKSVLSHAKTAKANSKSELAVAERLLGTIESPSGAVAAAIGVAGLLTGNFFLLSGFECWLALRGVDMLQGLKNSCEEYYHGRMGADALEID